MKSAVLALALITAFAAASLAAEETWSGTISDKMCGANHASMGTKMSDKDCTLACAKSGSPYVLVSGGKVYTLKNHEADLKAHAGEPVTITGELKGDTISVSKVAGAKAERP